MSLGAQRNLKVLILSDDCSPKVEPTKENLLDCMVSVRVFFPDSYLAVIGKSMEHPGLYFCNRFLNILITAPD